MTFLRLAPLVLIAAVAGRLIWKTMPAGTAPVAGPDPIAELIPAEIGGMTQWLLIRGADRAHPSCCGSMAGQARPRCRSTG